MAELWYGLVALLLAGYVVLDGFDLGAGAAHRLVARTDDERRAVLEAIGPFWDGNEVFLLAAGGALFVAFPRVLACALSGLYLAVMLVLWALLLRGLAVELRSHLKDGLWRAFWDAVFPLSSGGLALLLGVALGNVLRGFPLEADGYFALELFSVASPREARGVVDGYTLACGVLSLLVLAQHGARFLVLRAGGEVRERSGRLAERLTVPVVVVWALVTALTAWVAPAEGPGAARVTTLLPAVAAAVALAVSWRMGRRGRPRGAFVSSAVFVACLVGLAGLAMHPVLLRSTHLEVPSLTVDNAASEAPSLAAGLRWWFFAAALAVLYFVNLIRVHGRRDDPGRSAPGEP